jgi:Family of unknown function (DUF5994)
MTTGQTTTLLDQVDFARFEDDGGRPTGRRSVLTSTGVGPVEPAGPAGLPRDDAVRRLSLTRARGRGSFDGAWWPRTLNLAGELPGLVAALAAVGDPISHLSVNGDAWADIPRELARPGRPPLRVSWFRALDPYLVTLDSGHRPRIFLLVIPPDTAPGAAEELLRMAATGHLFGPSDQILRSAGAASPTA